MYIRPLVHDCQALSLTWFPIQTSWLFHSPLCHSKSFLSKKSLVSLKTFLYYLNLPQYNLCKSHLKVIWNLNKICHLPHVVSRVKPVPSHISATPWTSPHKPALNLSYSQIVKMSFTPRACDPGKPHLTTHDHKFLSISCVTTCDPGNVSGDLPRDWSSTRSLGRVNFKRATRPLIHIWQMVGTINERMGNQQSHKTSTNWGSSPMHSRHPNRRAPMEDSPTCPYLSNLSCSQNSRPLALCKPALNYAQTTLY